jgi:hypothetical protein
MATSDTDTTNNPVAGKVVDKIPPNNGQVPVKASELNDYLRSSAEADLDPDEGAYSRIIEQVLRATTPDIVLTPTEAIDAKDMVGIPLIMTGFDLNESEFDAGSPFYASIQAFVAQDETAVVINCGHKKVIAQLIKLREFDQWPYKVQFEQRGVSRIGGTPMLSLVKWEEQETAPF